MPESFRLSNDDPNCPYIVIRSETQRAPDGNKYLLRIKSPWDYDEVMEDENLPKIAVVGRSKRNNGVKLYLSPVDNHTPFPKGSIMIPIGDTNPLMARLIPIEFYTERDQFVLIPKPKKKRLALPLGNWEKMNHIQQIRDQAWRFGKGNSPVSQFHQITIQSVGRVDRIVGLLKWITQKRVVNFSKFNKHLAKMEFKSTRVSDIGSVEAGKRLVASRDLEFPDEKCSGYPYITATKSDNMNNMGGGIDGVGLPPIGSEMQNGKRVVAFNFDTGHSGYQDTVAVGERVPPNAKGGTISLAFDGDSGHAAYQPEAYYAGTQVGIITLKPEYSHKAVALFVAFSLSAESWRYQWKRKCYQNRFNTLTCLLPYKEDKIDVEGIKKLMKTLPKYNQAL